MASPGLLSIKTALAALLVAVGLLIGKFLIEASLIGAGAPDPTPSIYKEDEPGLRVTAPSPVHIMKDGVRTLIATGFVTNLTDEQKAMPRLMLKLIDVNDMVVAETELPNSSETIEPNSSSPYRFELPLESIDGLRLSVDFP